MVSCYPNNQIVLILSPNLSQSIAIARLLRRHCPDIYLIAGVVSGEHFHKSSLYDEVVDINFSNLGRFKNTVIIPTGAISMLSLCKIKKYFKVGEVEFSPKNLRVGDKNWMLELAKKLSIPVPKTWYIYQDIPKGTEKVFYKPKQEAGGSLRKMAKNPSLVPIQAQGDDYLFQEYIDSPGTYGYAFIAKNGKIICSEQHFEKHSAPKYGGSASIIETFDDARLTQYSNKMIKELNYSGWGLVEYKFCPKRNDFVFMEINAKFWASIEFTFRQNPCFSKMLFGLEVQPAKQNGLVWPARLLSSEPIGFLKSFHDIRRYPWIVEPNSIRMIVASLVPKRLKAIIKSLIK